MRSILIDADAIPALLQTLECPRLATVENAMTALYFLAGPATMKGKDLSP
jgi:hypothetical protein